MQGKKLNLKKLKKKNMTFIRSQDRGRNET